MLGFRQMKTSQQLASGHANIHDHACLQRDLIEKEACKERRLATLAR
jgi:hypothetical protein